MDLQKITKAVDKLRDAQHTIYVFNDKRKGGFNSSVEIGGYPMSDKFDSTARAIVDQIVTAQLDANVKAAEANLRKVMEEELRVPGDVAGGDRHVDDCQI